MNMSSIYNRIEKTLLQKKEAHLFRTTAPYNAPSGIDLSTNSYLWLHENEQVARATRALMGENLHGNCASRIISTQSSLFTELEAEIASWKKTESSLVFNSGYAQSISHIFINS